MSEELRRILAMVKDGRLSEEQASEMIEALNLTEGESSGDGHYRDEIRHKRHDRRRKRGRHSGRGDSDYIEDLGINIGSEVASIIDKSLRGLNSVLGGSSHRFGPTNWLNESNVNVMSRLHEPEGEGYTCRDNNFTVSKLDVLHLMNSRLCDNELHASAIKDISIENGEFNGNEMRGSSIKDLNISSGAVSNCQLNGAQLAEVTIDNGKIDDCALNGAQLRDINIDASNLTESNFNGVKVNDLKITDGSTVNELKMNGVKCRDLTIASSRVDALRFNGMNIESCHCQESAISHVQFRNKDWKDMIGRDSIPAPTLHDLHLDHFNAEHVEFINCNFENTVFRNCGIASLKFVGVDFSGLTLESEAAFVELAGQANDVRHA